MMWEIHLCTNVSVLHLWCNLINIKHNDRDTTIIIFIELMLWCWNIYMDWNQILKFHWWSNCPVYLCGKMRGYEWF
jgi:hypothetical protein